MQNTRFLQTSFWAQFKGAHGWNPISITENGVPLSVLVRTFRIGFKKASIAYVPMAPEHDGKAGAAYIKELNDIALSLRSSIPHDTMCVRFDPPVDFLTTEERDAFDKSLPAYAKETSSSVTKSPVAVQPPDTVLLSLDKSKEDLLNNMKPKWRYNVKLAEKKGVTVTAYHAGDAGFEEAFDSFYELFETTGKRDGISPHDTSLAVCRNERYKLFWTDRNAKSAAIAKAVHHRCSIFNRNCLSRTCVDAVAKARTAPAAPVFC